jgi:hypothetical protein
MTELSIWRRPFFIINCYNKKVDDTKNCQKLCVAYEVDSDSNAKNMFLILL